MKIKINGRELDFPVLDTLTFREARLLKKSTGLTMGKFSQALEEGDVDMLYGMAILAIARADGVVDTDAVLDLPIEKVEIETDDEDDFETETAEEGPTELSPEPETPAAAEENSTVSDVEVPSSDAPPSENPGQS